MDYIFLKKTLNFLIMKRTSHNIFLAISTLSVITFFSCASNNVQGNAPVARSLSIANNATIFPGDDISLEPIENENMCSRSIIGVGKRTQKELVNYFLKNNPNVSKRKVKRMAKYYIEEAKAEGINSDVAFVQMCHETGFLTFGNLVTVEMNNFCGLGSMDEEHKGESFKNERLGVRAHIQHLQAYATTEDTQLRKELVDPRYNFVHKTKFVNDIYGLAGTWASDPQYGVKLNAKLEQLESMSN